MSDPGRWSTDGWRSKATQWLDEQVIAAGWLRTGAVEHLRIRPWGTVLRAPTTAGQVWLKATAPATAFEVSLYPILHALGPDAILEPIATDPERGWLLLPDGGSHLGDLLEGDALVEALTTVLPRYAELQRTLVPAVPAMLTAGVTDMRPVMLPQRFDEALLAARGSVAEHGTTDEREMLARVAEARASVVAWAERLAASPVPPSIDHDDLHPGNMLVLQAESPATARFYDWGDSVVAHPFTSALVALRAVQASLGVGPDDPSLLRLRDAYLEPFSDLETHDELVATLEAACHTGKIVRSLVWHRTLGTMSPVEAGTFAGAPVYWLGQVLIPSWLGDLNS